jgi:hypothetical protein
MAIVKEYKTHIAKVRDVQSSQMNHVCQLLDITPEGYCWHQYRQYEKFLAFACLELPHLLEPLRYSSHVRGFWNNEWASRNQVDFLPYAYECKFERKEIMAEYLYINSAERLFREEEFYTRFINTLKII